MRDTLVLIVVRREPIQANRVSQRVKEIIVNHVQTPLVMEVLAFLMIRVEIDYAPTARKTEQGQTTLYASSVPLLIYLRGFRRDTGTRGTVLIRNGLMLGLKGLVRYATKKYL
jgi:hypothetical protein